MKPYTVTSVIHGLLTDSLYRIGGYSVNGYSPIRLLELIVMNEKNNKDFSVAIICLVVFIVMLCINPVITLLVAWIGFELWDSLIH